MGELDPAQGALTLDEVAHASQCRDLRIAPDARAVGRDAAVELDAGCFDEDKAGTFERVVA